MSYGQQSYKTFTDPCDGKVYPVMWPVNENGTLVVVRTGSRFFTSYDFELGVIDNWVDSIFSTPCTTNNVITQTLTNTITQTSEIAQETNDESQQQTYNPILVSSDLTFLQSINGKYVSAFSVGVSRASLEGDRSYNANVILYSTLKQFVFNGGYTKYNYVGGKLSDIKNFNVTTSYLMGSFMNMYGYTYIKPTKKYGTYGYNIGLVVLSSKLDKKYTTTLSTSVVGFWSKRYSLNKKVAVTPQFFIMNNPLGFNPTIGQSVITRQIGFLVGSGLDYRISKKFICNFNYRLNGSTNSHPKFLSNFLIGSRMVL